jgi:diguanylate cyclase (GGDEF)-like protein
VGRARVAVIVDRMHDYQVAVIRGAEQVIHSAGAALLVVVSHPLDSRQDMLLRALLPTGLIHGVVLTGLRDVSSQRNRVAGLAELVEHLPAVTVGLRVPRMPAVLSGNESGIRAAMTHLLDECGRRRPMMIAGAKENGDSDEREAAFLEVARERGLTLPRVPVVHGLFEREHAYRRLVELLTRGRDFDAVLAANDDMAMGVMDALKERGVRIPQDVAVVGFDNVPEGHRTKPPLSSVDNELVAQGRTAARLVLAQVAGRSVPEQVRPPATLVVRRSSTTGSPTDLSPAALAGLTRDRPGPGATTATVTRRVMAALATVIGPLDEDFRRRLLRLGLVWIPRVVDGRLAADDGEGLAADLVELVREYPEPLWWRGLTSTLQIAVAASAPTGRPVEPTRMAVMRLSLHVDRALAQVREEGYEDRLTLSENLLELNRALTRCRSLPDLTRELSAYLSRLNVGRCFLVLLDRHVDRNAYRSAGHRAGEGPAQQLDRVRREGRFGLARVVMSYRNGIVDAAAATEPFALDELLPPSLADELVHGTLTVQPLFTAERWFGVALHEQSTIDRHTGEALRLDVSRVLDQIARASELTERASELEALVSERTRQLEMEVVSRRAAQESLHEANLGLRRALLLDGLTGLQNRPSFDEHLSRAWHQHRRANEPLCLLMVDVDHFKRYNDTYGHLAGDTCLRRVAVCLQEAVTRKQDVVARYGGEEFAVILPGTGVEGGRLVALRLLRSLRSAALPHEGIGGDPGEKPVVSASIGLAATDAGGIDSPEALIEQADQALYAAKRAGRDRVECAVAVESP